MLRSEIAIDVGAVRRNVERLREVAGGSEVWAVVKADGYGHGAVDAGRAALDAGARALCVNTLGEALALRGELREARVLVMGPLGEDDVRAARDARLEVVVSAGSIPAGLPVHLKLDTGMGRWGLRELPAAPANVVGVMTHLATADCDLAFAAEQLERFARATVELQHLTRHAANSAAALRLPSSRLDAVRCGIALYGLSPFGCEPGDDGLEPVLRWTSFLAQVKRLEAGESTGYGRRYVAERPAWIGVVPVGYADGFRRDMTGAEVLVGGERCRVVGTVSMDALAVLLGGERPAGTPVTLVGDGILMEDHARVAGTINYEIACGIATTSSRARRVVVDG